MSGLRIPEVVEMLHAVSAGMIAKKDLLTQADKAIGDGDHGVGMARGFQAVRVRLKGLRPASIEEAFLAVGQALLGSIGGASGAVFGTLFSAGGRALAGKDLLDARGLAVFLRAGLEAVVQRGKAKPGDKTMVDALQPAAEEAEMRASGPLDEAAEAAARAGREGMETTKAMVARLGKAKTLGERSLGHADPGAVSMSLILDGMHAFLQGRGMNATTRIMRRAWNVGIVVPAFNIPYLPMMEPVIRALQDARSYGLVAVARPDWEKFEAGSPRAVCELYRKLRDPAVSGLHLDHVPVIDEDGAEVDWEPLIAEAIALGYDSVMIDASRLALAGNIDATRRVVEMAHQEAIPVEAELGAVFGHEDGPLPSYEELFDSGKGFTDPVEAGRFVEATGVDWLSVAVGNIHGAVARGARELKKVEARLHIGRIDDIRDAAGCPLVLHGGSGIRRESLREAFAHGIAKINIGTAVRHSYEEGLAHSPGKAAENVRRTTLALLTDDLSVAGSADVLAGA